MRKTRLPTLYNRKVILTGKIAYLYEYQKSVVKGKKGKKKGRANQNITDEQTKQANRNKTAQRAKKKVRDFLNANPFLNKFLTLTYAVNMTDIVLARYDFDKFIKRVKYYYKNIKYIAVLEFQKRGAVHFHLICNLPYVDLELFKTKIWKNGIFDIRKIDNVDNVGAYISKYMNKKNMDERLIGKKCYSMSRNLNKPIEIIDDKQIDEVLETFENVIRTYTTEYETEYLGFVRCTQIVCSDIIPRPKRRSRLWRIFDDDNEHPFGVKGETPLMA